jgi:hypothetical protein
VRERLLRSLVDASHVGHQGDIVASLDDGSRDSVASSVRFAVRAAGNDPGNVTIAIVADTIGRYACVAQARLAGTAGSLRCSDARFAIDRTYVVPY